MLSLLSFIIGLKRSAKEMRSELSEVPPYVENFERKNISLEKDGIDENDDL